METLLTDDPAEAAAFLRRGEVVAFPTETVYGLGADAFSEDAVRRIFAAKERPADNPLIVHVARAGDLARVAAELSDLARRFVEAFFPGPLTLVLPRHADVPDVVSAGLPTVGVRMPRHPVARAFIEACGVPVAAPSANRSGRPSPTTWEAAYADLQGRIPCVLRGERTEVGLESTVVDLCGETPVVLRAGAVTLEALRTVCPDARLAHADAAERHRSPGTRYRHYAPHARVFLVDAPPREPGPGAAYLGLTPPLDPSAFALVAVCHDVADYAHRLFDFFRRADEAGLTTIYAERVLPEGLGLALMDRLARAARG